MIHIDSPDTIRIFFPHENTKPTRLIELFEDVQHPSRGGLESGACKGRKTKWVGLASNIPIRDRNQITQMNIAYK